MPQRAVVRIGQDSYPAGFAKARMRSVGYEHAAYALDTLRAAGFRTGAIYDNDISGTREALLARADFLIASWEDLSPDEFLEKVALG